MNRNLGFEPAEIDHIILSHAHIDHSGLIPYLYKLGFRGSVVCTNIPGTFVPSCWPTAATSTKVT